jgi:hypothetical protein
LVHYNTKGSDMVGQIFQLRKYDEDGSGGDLVNSYAKTDTPVKTLNTVHFPATLQQGRIFRIHYRIKPTNAATYTLRLYAASFALDYKSNMRMLYESPALQASDTDYDRTELDIPFRLDDQSVMYFALEWSAAPGVTLGFIEVSGPVVK